MRSPGLLPLGTCDLLPPYAAFESWLVERCISLFEGYGYRRVKAPLVEFESSVGLFAGGKPETGLRCFDATSGQVTELRTDITPQVARIACTRMAHFERPLRLAYAGSVVLAEVKGGLDRRRQCEQVGIELIGSEHPEADVEVLCLTCESLQQVGMQELSVDMYTPTLLSKLNQAFGLSDERAALLTLAVSNKDRSTARRQAGPAQEALEFLMEISGEFDTVAPRVRQSIGSRLAGKEVLEIELCRLLDTAQRLRDERPQLKITLDALESGGKPYEEGVSFTLFAPGPPPIELGKGGRYKVGTESADTVGGLEAAVGATLYGEQLVQVIPPPKPSKRVFLPRQNVSAGSHPPVKQATKSRAAELRSSGWITVFGLEPAEDDFAEARRLGCTHVMVEQEPVALGSANTSKVLQADDQHHGDRSSVG